VKRLKKNNLSLEVILRAECVEKTQAGDRCDFIGTLIVVPDVSKLGMAGVRAETSQRVNGSDETEGVSGLKALGVRELTYKMAFLAYHVQPCNAKVGLSEMFREIICLQNPWNLAVWRQRLQPRRAEHG
jgi:DNA replication licensing factor MCM6